MPIDSKDPQEQMVYETQFSHRFFFYAFVFMLTMLNLSFFSRGGNAASTGKTAEISEELGAEDKQARIKMLLEKGDRYRSEKNYEVARGIYEEIFLLDPNNRQASERIDFLKHHLQKEGRNEDQIASGLYDDEIKGRIEAYRKEADQWLKEKKWGRARFALEKLLLLNPLDEKASALHKELKRAIAEGREPTLSKFTGKK